VDEECDQLFLKAYWCSSVAN